MIFMGLFIFFAKSIVCLVPLLLPSQKAISISQPCTISLLRSKYYRAWYLVFGSVLNFGKNSLYCMPCLCAQFLAIVSAPLAPPARIAVGLLFNISFSIRSLSVKHLEPVMPIFIVASLGYQYIHTLLTTNRHFLSQQLNTVHIQKVEA